jgi:hypothetical protein
MRLLALLLLAFSSGALAQYQGPAVEACRALALREAATQDGNKPEDIVIDRDRTLLVERYGRKMGSQRIALILTGNGAVVLPGTPSAELSFVCLLADEKRAVFFNWLPRGNVSALAQCTRSKEMRGKTRECLDFLLRVAETDLTQVYAERFQEAHERGEDALAAYRASNEQWREYVDAECLRRARSAKKDAEAHQLACRVELMRQRGREMR